MRLPAVAVSVVLAACGGGTVSSVTPPMPDAGGDAGGTDTGGTDTGGTDTGGTDTGGTDTGGTDAGGSDTGGADTSVADTGPLDGAVADSPSTDADASTLADAPLPNDGTTAADVDNGMPSTTYPAPHPPLPTLVNAAGGPVLHTPNIHLVLYPNDARETDLVTFSQRIGASTYWSAATAEYGVGPISYAGTTVLLGQTAPGMITSAQIQSWVGQQIQSGAFGTPDPQAIYTIVYPSGTTIQQPNPVSPLLAPVTSCTNFAGFHDNVSVALTDGGAPTAFEYAVLATCGQLGDLTPVMSHEWIEASTDPQVTANGVFTLNGGPNSGYFSVDSDHVVWAVLGSGGEAGDLCQPEEPAAIYTPADVGYAVQRTWSNVLAAASHDPCAPDLAGLPFFTGAPVLDEAVTINSPLIGTVTTKGVTIPVGQSKTIEVDLFSDAATGGPWTVAADDLLARQYGAYGLTNTLSFAWDRTQGTNGEKLHLTITVTASSILGGAHAFEITSTLGSRSYVWPGVVVE
jgi:hypothetical protein